MKTAQAIARPLSDPDSIIQQQIETFYENLPQGVVVSGLSVGAITGVDNSGDPIITTVYSGYANVGNQTPIAADTIFEIGSMTKTFTTTMLADAVNAGTMALGDSAQSYYDQYEPSVILPFYTDPSTQTQYPMTLLDLADYTSGIPDKSPTNTTGPNEYPFSAMHDYLTNDFPDGLPVQPGTAFKYVNTNFGIIAELVMLTNGFAEYDDALQALIANAALTMPNTGVITCNTPSIPNLAQGYQSNGTVENDYALPTWPALQGAGGIYSSLGDMLYWLQFNMGLTDSPYNNLLPVLQQVRFPAGSTHGEGLGWFIGAANGTTMISKDGGTSGFHSWIGFTPDSTTGVVVLCNTSLPGSPVDDLGIAILKALNS